MLAIQKHAHSYQVRLTLTLRSSLRVTLMPLVAANLNNKTHLQNLDITVS